MTVMSLVASPADRSFVHCKAASGDGELSPILYPLAQSSH
jgi:hypothetical protein